MQRVREEVAAHGAAGASQAEGVTGAGQGTAARAGGWLSLGHRPVMPAALAAAWFMPLLPCVYVLLGQAWSANPTKPQAQSRGLLCDVGTRSFHPHSAHRPQF